MPSSFAARVRGLHRLDGIRVQAVDDGRRRSRRREDAVPRRHLVTGKPGLLRRRHIRKRLHTRSARHGDRTQLARLHVRRRGRHGVEGHLVHAAEQVLHRLAGAFIRNVDQLHAGQALEDLAREVRHAAVPRRRKGQLRFAFQELDEFLQVLGMNRWMHSHEVRHRGGDGHRREILDHVVRQIGEQRRRDRVHRHVAHHDRVAIGRRFGDLSRGHGAGRARPVLDHDRLAEELRHARRQDARHDVGAAARRKADHHANRLVRVARNLSLGLRRPGEQRQEEKNFSHRMQL